MNGPLRAISNLPRQEANQKRTRSVNLVRSAVAASVDVESEYSDPEIVDETSSYDEDYDYDDLTAVDRRNMGKPAKVAKYAEMIFSIARQGLSAVSVSSEQFKSTQSEITPQMHETAIRWILMVQQEYQMSNDTMYEAVTYLNIILCKSPVRKSQLQLVTLTCLWMASKIEERVVPKLEEFSLMCSNQYKIDDFIKCERKLLRLLDFRLSFPTAKFFLRRLLDSIDAEYQVVDAANFFCDLSLLPIPFLDYQPNIIAMAAVCLGKLCLNEFCPTLRLQAYGHINELTEVRKCAQSMLSYAPVIINDPKHILYGRYSTPEETRSVFKLSLSVDVSKALSNPPS